MSGAAENGTQFHGVDLGWMQAMWRDCADKEKQLGIFRDMVGKKVTDQEILDAVGDPAWCGPVNTVKREYRPYTPEEDERIVELAAEGRTTNEIAEAIGRNTFSVSNRIKVMRGRGVEVRRGAKKPAPETASETAPEIASETAPEIASEIAPEPVTQITETEPEEAGGASGTEACLSGIRQEILELRRAEEDLTAALIAVRARKAEIRLDLAGLIEMMYTEGGEGDG